MNIVEITQQTKSMIDNLKAVCTTYGLGNSSGEYKIITEIFLYKFLNDKFIYMMKQANPEYVKLSDQEVEQRLSKLSEDEYEMATIDVGGSTAKLKREQFISYLFNHQNEKDFHKLFDKTLVGIANDNIEIFAMQTGGQSRIKLFDPLSPFVIEEEKRDAFCKAMIEKLVNASFSNVFEQKYDFFADVFEYLIKDYNKDSGKYAEYYTPHSIATILARILVPESVKNVTVYDPAAGTGTLVLAIAHAIGEDNCTIYTQDISQKANEFLRLNLILNNLVHSLPNVVHDDTLVSPYHQNETKTGIATFDYIVCNPPFNMDFSETRETLAGEKYKPRFFAGVPNVPNKKKDGMAVYQMFLQHIIKSLNDTGKAAIVVPTGFLTAGSGIPLKIRQHMVDNHMLRGVISMPSNIFANTGTNVSVLFLEKQHKGNVILMDASKLGTKEKIDNNQRTVLSPEEIDYIVQSFNAAEPVEDFCVTVTEDQIKEKKYSFSAGQYFDVKIEYVNLTPEEFAEKMQGYQSKLQKMFEEGHRLEKEIKLQIGWVKYEQSKDR